MPYCKTYEEIRLEEIQAESAAYYSYSAIDYAGTAVSGKEKRSTIIRSARQTVSFSRVKNQGSDLNFKVLTLEEIKRNRNRKYLFEKPEAHQPAINPPMKREEETLSGAISTLAELKKLNILETRKRLATMDNQKDDSSIEQVPKRRRINSNTIVPPVRLRRSPNRFSRTETQTSETTGDATSESLDNSRTEIEVRLCDSSTDETSGVNRVSTSVADKDKKESADVVEDLKIDGIIDGHTHADDVDSASDDILKDIDALLTEKTV